MAASPDGNLSQLQEEFANSVQTHILKTTFPLEALPLITAEDLRDRLSEIDHRNRILRALIVAACIDGEMKASAVAKVEEFARCLAVDLSPVETAWKLANQNLLFARIDIIRRSLPGVKMKEVIDNDGVLEGLKQFFPLAGIELDEVAAKYRALEHYPEGTLGKEYVNYLRRNDFPFPGEIGAGPEIIVIHDCLHVLGDYGTSPSEEVEVASFQAGCHFEEPLYGLLFGLAQYHLNIQMGHISPAQPLQADPEKMLAAYVRGCSVNRDMWRDFNPWDHFAKPVKIIRQEIGLI
ncbi:hypothetical protein [Bdellovibrio sp. HCB2-146]|uniref:hypothetical protein n=1 Tax=Bdellovibrio sp. HCB2-146 TaxID=3394362 RepID=UPI0039BC64E6